MSDGNAVELLKRGDRRFSKRSSLDSLRQEIALNFAPYHASWTSSLTWGEDFAAHLVDGTPLLLARDFVGQVGSMLRPSGKQWFWHRTAHDDTNNVREHREYLDWRSGQMLRIMTDSVTGFHRATKIADEFFSLFGDAVLSVDTDEMMESLRIHSWHTKDVVWAIGAENKPDTVTRKEMLPARVIKARFRRKGDTLHHKMTEACEKDGDQEFEIRHEVIPADEYDAYVKKKSGKGRRVDGWYSVWLDVTNRHVMREAWQRTLKYVIPRWVTLPGNPYAISPATTIALPDARLIQQQMIAILEAAEKSINPPLIATADTVRGDVRLESRGITWVDKAYDQRTGAPVTPLELGKNFQLGVEALMRTEAQLTRAFFLDILRMPDTRNSKSTLEVQFKIDEYVRAALPLFSPMQSEYNDPLLMEIDTIVEAAGGYDMREKPDALKKEQMVFTWDNPLTDMLERQKAQKGAELGQLGQAWAALEAAAAQAPALKQIDTAKGFRESAISIGVSSWLLDEDAAAAAGEAITQGNQMREAVAAAPNIAQVIDSGVNAATVAATIPNPSEVGYPMLPSPV